MLLYRKEIFSSHVRLTAACATRQDSCLGVIITIYTLNTIFRNHVHMSKKEMTLEAKQLASPFLRSA